MEHVSFGRYRFAQNPREITVEASRRAVVQTLPGRGQQVQSALPALRRVRLTGELFAPTAEGALEQYKALRAVYEQRGSGLLSLPGHTPFYAHFVRLWLQAVGDGRTLRYRAEFLEGEARQ